MEPAREFGLLAALECVQSCAPARTFAEAAGHGLVDAALALLSAGGDVGDSVRAAAGAAATALAECVRMPEEQLALLQSAAAVVDGLRRAYEALADEDCPGSGSGPRGFFPRAAAAAPGDTAPGLGAVPAPRFALAALVEALAAIVRHTADTVQEALASEGGCPPGVQELLGLLGEAMLCTAPAVAESAVDGLDGLLDADPKRWRAATAEPFFAWAVRLAVMRIMHPPGATWADLGIDDDENERMRRAFK